jgi:hypothetical protein
MVVNFRAREISQGARKLARTSTLIKKKNLQTKRKKKEKKLSRLDKRYFKSIKLFLFTLDELLIYVNVRISC